MKYPVEIKKKKYKISLNFDDSSITEFFDAVFPNLSVRKIPPFRVKVLQKLKQFKAQFKEN